MDCVCGCGRKVPKQLTDRNFTAAGVALELLAWDKNRALPGAGPEGREGLIARGVECYEQLLYSLHEEGGGDPDPAADAWLAESGEMRADNSDMTKKRFFGSSAPNVSREDMARIDRRHPERSFTGGAPAPASGVPVPGDPVPTSAPAASAPSRSGDDDVVEKLERLRAMRDDDVLTEEEFAAAKARLLGRD
jgi:hypothetical protein